MQVLNFKGIIMNDLKPKKIRIEIPTNILEMALKSLETLSLRGSLIKIDSLFTVALERLDQKYFDQQVERLTPEAHILDEAKNDPEIMALLSIAAKKLLDAKRDGKPINIKRGRKPNIIKAATNNL